MTRSKRLLDLVHILRTHEYPVSVAALASELGVNKRTISRDIITLQDQGANIEGEPKFGYILHPGFLLPPLMFTEEELDALALGSRWVVRRGDAILSTAAQDALGKIANVVPTKLQPSLRKRI